MKLPPSWSSNISISSLIYVFRFHSFIHLESRIFFSSRRRHTISLRDWSSDVCSSDLVSSLVNEQLGTGQRHTTCRAGDHRDLAIELSHDDSIHWIVPILCTQTCVPNVSH